MSGSSTFPAKGLGQTGVYGTEGVAATSNVPGGRNSSVSWTDSSSNLWLFGGNGVDAAGTYGGLNDLWEFNPTAKEWTWLSGSNTANAKGSYGTQGVAAIGNVPGSRDSSVGWIDDSGNLWLFGGSGVDSSGYNGLLNDLWEFNPAAKTWTWVSGSIPSNTQVGQTGTYVGPTGIYGTLGVAAASSVPGGRYGSVGWADNSGNLWLFGGDGYDSIGTEGYLNDLWEFNSTAKTWTWVSGSSTANAPGEYGTLGSAATTNIPGGRENAVRWIDSSGNLWLFGGVGSNATILNDLWEFSPTSKAWTWVSGSNTANANSVYGTLGTPSTANIPGARYSAVSWIDKSGNLWLFGGEYLSNGTYESLNDLWEFSPTTKAWTWVGGSSTANATGVYGTLGTPSSANVPGARWVAVSWVDGSGNFWLFGGNYTADAGTVDVDFNDLWRYPRQNPAR
ncbi:MAG TPA: kelch repeat-containing protein [Terracidiphilus sp.]